MNAEKGVMATSAAFSPLPLRVPDPVVTILPSSNMAQRVVWSPNDAYVVTMSRVAEIAGMARVMIWKDMKTVAAYVGSYNARPEEDGVACTGDGRLWFVNRDGSVVLVAHPEMGGGVEVLSRRFASPHVFAGASDGSIFIQAGDMCPRVLLVATGRSRIVSSSENCTGLGVDPHGKSVVIVSDAWVAGGNYVGTLQLRPLPHLKSPVIRRASCGARFSNPVYSPDGSRIAVGCSKGHVHVFTSSALEERDWISPPRAPSEILALAWSTNGHLCAVGMHKMLLMIDMRTGNTIRIFDDMHHDVVSLAASPDSRRLLVNTHGVSADIAEQKHGAAIFDFGSPNFGTDAATHWADASFG
ncbi:WD40 repeat domain-containing protein [Candidatus Uhrbacteria bacterium]|nr:WD40 repeat domain-containing protein [Candidatus Uhrbacteria bacterium]